MSGDPASNRLLADIEPSRSVSALEKLVAELTPAPVERLPDAPASATTTDESTEEAGGAADERRQDDPGERPRWPEFSHSPGTTRPILKVVAPRAVAVQPDAEPPSPIAQPSPDPPKAASAPAQLPRTVDSLPGGHAEVGRTPVGHRPAGRRWTVVRVAIVALSIVAACEALFLVWSFRTRPASSGTSTGIVFVESTPSGAAIAINGQQRGTTPSTLTLPAGDYSMSITSGKVVRVVPLVVRAGNSSAHVYLEDDASVAGSAVAPPDSVTPSPSVASPPAVALTSPTPARGIAASRPAASSPSPPAAAAPSAAGTLGGWLRVDSPVEVQIFENGALIGSSQSDRIMLPIGSHVLTAVNSSLGYQESRTVRVGTGSLATTTLSMPLASVNINALPWAEVAVDGKRLGPTPLGNVTLPIGPHEIVFTHPQLGERRQNIVVTLNGPNRVTVNLNQR